MTDKLVEFIGKNVVLLANQFNLSIFNQYWLIDNGIIEQDDLKGGYTFTPIFNQIKAKNYELTIVPDRLQFNISPNTDINEIGLIKSKIGKIVEKLPHTPYKALGVNFIYLFTPEDDNFQSSTKLLFSNPKSPLSVRFDAEDARYGGYFSIDMSGFLVKLTALPIKTPNKNNLEIEKMKFDFNFHIDLKDKDDYKTILEYLNKWEKLKDFTEEIMYNTL